MRAGSDRTSTPKRLLASLTALVVTATVLVGIQALAVTDAEAAMPPIREITFPVLDDSAWYGPDWHAPRGGGTRVHLGTDIFAPKLTRLLAARSGVISRGRLDSSGISGNYIAITDAEGWEYLYIHINNDSPGTDDGANPPQYRLLAGLGIGSVVQRGQPVAFMGDSGNAEGTNSHVHFEIRQPRRGSRPVSINAFPSLRVSQGREIGDHCEWGSSPSPTETNAIDVGYRSAYDDGGIFTHGESDFHGSPGGLPLVRPVVAGQATPSGRGYWLVAADGGVFTYGDARFWGSLGGRNLDSSIVDVAATRGGRGYWLLSRAGGIYPFGTATWHGSVQSSGLCADRQGRALLAGADGVGYWIMTTDGEVRPFGSARALGDRRHLSVTPAGSPVALLGAARAASAADLAALEPLPLPDPASQAATANDGRPWPPEPDPDSSTAEPASAPGAGSGQQVVSELALVGGPEQDTEPPLALAGDHANSIVVPAGG